MRYWMYVFTVVSFRSLAPIGKRVGVVMAEDEGEAKNKIFDQVWSDCSCNLNVWEIFPQNGEMPSYTVYKSQI